MTDILAEASALINGDRLDTYEGTDDTIVALWSAYLGTELTVLDYANLMILLKVARTKGKYHHDSYVDIAGYAEVGPRLWEEKQVPVPSQIVQILPVPIELDEPLADWERELLGLPPVAPAPRVWNDLYLDVPCTVGVSDVEGGLWHWTSGAWHRNGVSVPRDEWDFYAPFTEVKEKTA